MVKEWIKTKLRKCAICGKEFESHNGKLVCSEECRLERKKQQDRKGNYRRSNGLSNVSEEKICPVCGERFEALGNIKYCSISCYERERKKLQKENFRLYYEVPKHRSVIQERSRLRKKGRQEPQG